MKKHTIFFLSCILTLSLVSCTDKSKDAPVTPSPIQADNDEEEYFVAKDPHAADYEGLWSCNDYNIWIGAEDMGIKAEVEYKQDEYNYTTWIFSCLYEEETSSFTDPGYGIKTVYVYDDDGKLVSDSIVSDKEGCRFTIDKKGFLNWKNFNEDIASGLRFQKTSDNAVSMWKDTDESTLLKIFPDSLFKNPEGSESVHYSLLDNRQPNEDISELAEMVFSLNGHEYTARMQKGKDVDWDISGTYYFWAEEKDVKLKEWGKDVKAKYYNTVEAESAEALLIWHDPATVTQYSLYYHDDDGKLDYTDLIDTANKMHR